MILTINSKKHGSFDFLIDDNLSELVKKYCWCVSVESRSDNKLIYAVGWVSPKTKDTSAVRLHRLLTNASSDTIVDHINGNTLDNRLSNLRIVDHTTNMQNARKRSKATSKFKGVSWNKRRLAWRARLYCYGLTRELGFYSTEVEAAAAYNEALDFYGIQSPRNIIDLK